MPVLDRRAAVGQEPVAKRLPERLQLPLRPRVGEPCVAEYEPVAVHLAHKVRLADPPAAVDREELRFVFVERVQQIARLLFPSDEH